LSIIGAEIIGTAILILLGDGVVAAVVLSKSKAENSGWIVITFGWGMAVAMAVYAVGRFDGAHLNPAVTLGVWLNGGINGAKAWKYFVGEFLGAMLGACLVVLAYWLQFKATEDKDSKLAVFCTAPAERDYKWNVVTEIIGTMMLMFGILAIGDVHNTLATTTGGLTPLVIGLLVLAIGLSLGGPTGYAINPARDLGPRIVHAILPIPGKRDSDWSYAWVPVIAPLLGSALAVGLFRAFFPLISGVR
jgi:glycerol uptake facilitator protein